MNKRKICVSTIYTYSKFLFEGIYRYKILLIFSLLICYNIGNSQSKEEKKSSEIKFFQKADTLNKKRFIPSATFSAASYTGFSIGLYHAWYKEFDQGPFQLFDDSKEWAYMDKYGHFYTAYFQGVLVYKGAKWTGLSEDNSILTGFLLGTLFQSTIEVMDGFSSKWGFSVADIGMNFAGSSAFVFQQKYWGEQRITFKMSNVVRSYPSTIVTSIDGMSTTTLLERADNLFGSSIPERFLKDYNSQVYWLCVDVKKFIPDSSYPKWLNIAVGYSAGNLYGGFDNSWEFEGAEYEVNDLYPRYSRILFAPDINLSSIRTKSYFWNGVLDIFDIFHVPVPALEINTLGEVHFHFSQ